ncbi:hypothetical protein SAMN04487939_104286 [Lysobacter sp. yr284]|uniref:PIN domain-containing protein n=1 Tax=Lysobacter sp. yr284 TaxID=1761791 RepID=UPI00089BB651|nr:PIN domain-containing protein [Lysobacter sp. yr284]SDY65677.1 hypothetical protein SAMN04487939_104286 [Lysobacter sp. yr284]
MEPFDVAGIAARNVPVLCMDTCSILDLIREPTRDDMRDLRPREAMKLLDQAQAGRLALFMAPQVHTEFREHVDEVSKQAEIALKKFVAKIEQVNAHAAEFGAENIFVTDHWDGHVARAKGKVDLLLQATMLTQQPDDAASRAYLRMCEARAPARMGKDSMKDCVVIETYLQNIRDLREAGHSEKVVFLSSNVKEYRDEAKLRAELDVEFKALGIEYAHGYGLARHILGFPV